MAKMVTYHFSVAAWVTATHTSSLSCGGLTWAEARVQLTTTFSPAEIMESTFARL